MLTDDDVRDIVLRDIGPAVRPFLDVPKSHADLVRAAETVVLMRAAALCDEQAEVCRKDGDLRGMDAAEDCAAVLRLMADKVPQETTG